MRESLWVYSHPQCLEHNPGAGHPEAAFRLRAVLDTINELDLECREAPEAERAAIERAHSAELVARLYAAIDITESQRIDPDTAMGPGSIRAALRAAGAGLAALDDVLAGRCKRVFCAVRPPGHHATRDQAMGFCLINSIAVVAQAALDRGLARVSIVDFDVHHGNGTQAIFWSEAKVQYVSSHQAPLYPGSGDADEKGAHGQIVNAPLPAMADGVALRRAYENVLLPAISAFSPELILISAGFDGHALDPLAGLNLHAEDYHWLTQKLCAQADISAHGRVISMLEGGYSESALRCCSRAHLRALGSESYS